MYADVYVGYPLEGPFTYFIPEQFQVSPGKRVRVNFAGRNIVAFVCRVHDETPTGYKVKDIVSVIDNDEIFDQRLMDLARYVSSSYLSYTGELLAMALPSGTKPSDRYKIPFEKKHVEEKILSPEQDRVFDDIKNTCSDGQLRHLIFGITGSGKTEVYISMARHLIKQGRSVIYLVPEISLTSQIFERLYSVFGDELVVYHSHLTANQRLHHWMKFNTGKAKIAVGTRSAVFMQCPDLGMIIIDEEHDGSYKEHSSPRYNARRIAFYRSKKENAVLIMGSATPSVESLYAAENGIIKLHELKNRFGSSSLPEIEIVKVNSSREQDILSSKMKLYTKKAVDNSKQVIYLLNRRGFAPFVICQSCGESVQCPNCNISLNFHKEGNVVCHYCGYSRRVPDKCLNCGSDDIVKIGTGTQKAEEFISKTFNDLTIFRLDQDSSRKKNSSFEFIDRMQKGEIDVLIGTQMVAKGFDFPGVVLVGVLLADIGLNLPDFRASERIFSLLMQVAGRSGRGDSPGKVLIQTIDDQQEIFRYIRNHDYYGFYKNELNMRRSLDYPPFSRIARLLVRGKDEKKVTNSIKKLKNSIDSEITNCSPIVKVLGPSEAPLSKISSNFRHHIILKSKSVAELRKLISRTRDSVSSRDVYLEIDIDPHDML